MSCFANNNIHINEYDYEIYNVDNAFYDDPNYTYEAELEQEEDYDSDDSFDRLHREHSPHYVDKYDYNKEKHESDEYHTECFYFNETYVDESDVFYTDDLEVGYIYTKLPNHKIILDTEKDEKQKYERMKESDYKNIDNERIIIRKGLDNNYYFLYNHSDSQKLKLFNISIHIHRGLNHAIYRCETENIEILLFGLYRAIYKFERNDYNKRNAQYIINDYLEYYIHCKEPETIEINNKVYKNTNSKFIYLLFDSKSILNVKYNPIIGNLYLKYNLILENLTFDECNIKFANSIWEIKEVCKIQDLITV